MYRELIEEYSTTPLPHLEEHDHFQDNTIINCSQQTTPQKLFSNQQKEHFLATTFPDLSIYVFALFVLGLVGQFGAITEVQISGT